MPDSTLRRSGVYVIRNNVSGRVYVGSAANIGQRWNAHRHQLRLGKHHSATLQRSWNKHGPLAFSFHILEFVDNPDDLFTREQHWIDTLHAACPVRGFNMHPKSGGPRGHKLSAETCAKMSQDRKGRKLPPRTPEHRANISAAKQGWQPSPEWRAKASAARKGKKKPPFTTEHRAAISAARSGKKASPECRDKMSAASKGKPKAADHAAKLRTILSERNRSDVMRSVTAKRNAQTAAARRFVPDQMELFISET